MWTIRATNIARTAARATRYAPSEGPTDRPADRVAEWGDGMFVALIVHTLAYAGFYEDPFTWVLLAMAGSLAIRPSA